MTRLSRATRKDDALFFHLKGDIMASGCSAATEAPLDTRSRAGKGGDIPIDAGGNAKPVSKSHEVRSNAGPAYGGADAAKEPAT